MTDHDDIDTIREFVQSGGYELRKMTDGSYSAVATKTTPILSALDSLAASLAEKDAEIAVLRDTAMQQADELAQKDAEKGDE